VPPFAALRKSRRACSLVSFELLSDGGSSTPARRAFDNPIAIACFVERAPCFPSRTCSISSLTNSPACVLGAFPARLSLRARSIVCRSGITHLRMDAAGVAVVMLDDADHQQDDENQHDESDTADRRAAPAGAIAVSAAAQQQQDENDDDDGRGAHGPFLTVQETAVFSNRSAR